MASQSKAQLLTDAFDALKSRYKITARANRFAVLEAVIYGICHEGMTREQANQALSRFKDEFFDWNEVRVSALRDIQTVFAGFPDPETRAQLVRRFLRQLFKRTYGFTLEAVQKKPLKDAVKDLQEYEALKSDYVSATVIQLSLNGHALPLDAAARRGLERLGVTDEKTAPEALRSTVERAVPKNRGIEFVDLLEDLTHDTCVDGEPECGRCVLRTMCAYALAKGKPAKAEAATPKPSKPRLPLPVKAASAKQAAPPEPDPASPPAPKGSKPPAAAPKSGKTHPPKS